MNVPAQDHNSMQHPIRLRNPVVLTKKQKRAEKERRKVGIEGVNLAVQWKKVKPDVREDCLHLRKRFALLRKCQRDYSIAHAQGGSNEVPMQQRTFEKMFLTGKLKNDKQIVQFLANWVHEETRRFHAATRNLLGLPDDGGIPDAAGVQDAGNQEDEEEGGGEGAAIDMDIADIEADEAV
jgi:hypothetical protein